MLVFHILGVYYEQSMGWKYVVFCSILFCLYDGTEYFLPTSVNYKQWRRNSKKYDYVSNILWPHLLIGCPVKLSALELVGSENHPLNFPLHPFLLHIFCWEFSHLQYMFLLRSIKSSSTTIKETRKICMFVIAWCLIFCGCDNTSLNISACLLFLRHWALLSTLLMQTKCHD